jgi:hypothetical protein
LKPEAETEFCTEAAAAAALSEPVQNHQFAAAATSQNAQRLGLLDRRVVKSVNSVDVTLCLFGTCWRFSHNGGAFSSTALWLSLLLLLLMSHYSVHICRLKFVDVRQGASLI